MSESKASRAQEAQNSSEFSAGLESTAWMGLLFLPFPAGSCLLKCAKGEEGVHVLPDDPNHPRKSAAPST